MDENLSKILDRLHQLELTVMSKLNQQGTDFRDRVEDVERKTALDIATFRSEIQKQIQDLRVEMLATRNKDQGSILAIAISLLSSIGMGLFTYFLGHK